MAKAKQQELTLEERLEQALVPEDEQPYEVLGNWVWTKTGYVIDVIMGQSPSGEDTTDNDDYTGLIGGAADMGELFPRVSRYTMKPTKLSQDGDVILSIRATLGRPILSDGAYCLGRGVCALRSGVISNLFTRYFILNFEEYLYSVATGTTFTQISKNDLEGMPFPLPPLTEQQRIVDRIEGLFAKLDSAKELAQNALDTFETRKAAILHKAFTSELTAKWREKHPSCDNEVFDRISLFMENSNKKDKDHLKEQQNKISILPQVKNSKWYKCTIGAIGIVTNGSTPSRSEVDYWNGNIPWVSSGEVKNNQIFSTNERITELGYENSSVKMLPIGTVLIAMIGEGKTRGQSSVLEISATTNQNIAAIIIEHGNIVPKFLWYWLQKQYQKNREKGNGTGPQALNCQRVRELDCIIPPLSEQQEIVRVLDDLFEKDQKAKELCDVIDKIDLMKKAILARAFRGELGTNDPSEESAVELLKECLK